MTTKTATKLPAAAYWCADPCYLIQCDGGNDRWMAWLEACDYRNNHALLDGLVDGHRVVAASTAHGDGVYEDQEGRDYPVDAGLIGVVPAALWTGAAAPFGAHLIEFPAPFDVSATAKGLIKLGHIRIRTGW